MRLTAPLKVKLGIREQISLIRPNFRIFDAFEEILVDWQRETGGEQAIEVVDGERSQQLLSPIQGFHFSLCPEIRLKVQESGIYGVVLQVELEGLIYTEV